MRRPLLAWSLCALTCAVVVAFAVVYFSPLTPAAVFSEAGDATTAIFVLPYLAFAVAGGLIAARRPDNPVGWLILAGALMISLGASSDLAASDLAHAHNPLGGWIGLGGALWAGGESPATAVFTAATLLFPNGRLLSRWWGGVIWLAVALAAVNCIAVAINPAPGAFGIGYSADPTVNPASPLGIPGALGFASADYTFSGVAELILFVPAIVSVFLRLRGADSEQRHQIKWFGAGVSITVAISLALDLLPSNNVTSPATLVVLGLAAFISGMGVPVGVGVAMLKYRLYDIDIIISRTLVYGALAVFITAVYVGIVVGIGTAIGAGKDPNLALSILATAVVATGFQPLRERVQRVANRLVYGRRATPYQVLSSFAGELAATHAAEEVLPRMAAALRDGTGAETAVVWLRHGAELRPVAAAPGESLPALPVHLADQAVLDIPGMNLVVAVNHGDEQLGALSLRKRRSEPFSPAEARLVSDLAAQAGLVLKNVGLTDELLRRRDDVLASRRRLVTAQDDERRRLERNLHDGAQQYLVAIKVKVSLAAALARKNPERARTAVQELKADADEALDTLRDLARGIYPPLLADKGLVAALESQARKATIDVTVTAGAVERYPQDIEATAYFCCLEALQNCQKYAEATRATIRLREDAGRLSFEVQDDGRGFDVPSVSRGAGLTNMADRIEALGGSLEVHSTPGGGTTVRGTLPLAVAAAA